MEPPHNAVSAPRFTTGEAFTVTLIVSMVEQPLIEQVDALYMTRIQKEHNHPSDEAAFAAIDFSRYKLTRELVARMKSYAPILHPFPRDQHFGEIPPEIDDDPRAMYFRQARNGMWIRAALLAHIFNVDHQITRFFHDHIGSR